MPAAWLGHRWVGHETVRAYAARCGAEARLETVHPPAVASNPLPRNVARRDDLPGNFRLRLSDGVTVPVPAGSADVVYSHQLMEHLHPDDAAEQLREIVAALVPGGAYVCVTPSRLSGPHDISRHFDAQARGLHLKEYTPTELMALFARAGFAQTRAWITLRGRRLPVPGAWVRSLERRLEQASPGQRRRLLERPPYRWFSTLQIVARKAQG